MTFPEEPRSPRRGKARNSDRSQFRPVFHLLTCPSQRELHKKEESDNEDDEEHIQVHIQMNHMPQSEGAAQNNLAQAMF